MKRNKAKKADKVRRVDRRTNALPTDRQTDRQTDKASYRGALSHLKINGDCIGYVVCMHFRKQTGIQN